ncbi:MAG: hypothetical protein LBM93_09235 [Oscillospiraceae bacterium]|jgi:replicative DNA helicase|nr:hypothetical protein [Oscillospiraceae bacterium]
MMNDPLTDSKDKELEEALLCGILLLTIRNEKNEKDEFKDKLTNKILKHINESDFYIDIHKSIFKILKDALKKKKYLDNILLYKEAKKVLKDKCPKREFFSYLENKVKSIVAVEHYAMQVKNLSLIRQQIEANDKMMQDIRNGTTMNEAMEKYQKKIEELKEKSVTFSDPSPEEYKQENLTQVEDVFNYFKDVHSKVKTGFNNLDEALDGGLHTGLYILGATCGVGKTTFMLQIIDNIARKEQDVLFFSIEMSRREIIAKSISRLSYEKKGEEEKGENGLSTRAILNQAETNTDTQETIAKFEEIYCKKIAPSARIVDGVISIETVKESIAQHKRITNNNPVVFIDYLQAIKFKGNRDKREQIDEAITKLRILASEYDTPIFIISSLNRDSYRINRSDKSENKQTIGLADFKESGGIEYGADVILAMQYNDKKDKENESDGKRNMDLRILKNRMGRSLINDGLSFDFYYKFNFFKDNKNEKEINENPKDKDEHEIIIGLQKRKT